MSLEQQSIIEADLTYMDGRFQSGIRIIIDTSGTITDLGAIKVMPTRRLRHRALIPGMVNAHSHAFQRGLRGRGETFPQGAGSFWTWRKAMYELVESMDAQQMHRLSMQAFSEMLAAGITTVGEFHYLHHDERMHGFGLDEVVLRAARDAGIRIVLIQCYYNTGGVLQPLTGGQLRFACASPEQYWQQFDRLAEQIDPATQSLAASAHSIRAAAIDDVATLHEQACRRALPFHMHVEEQPQEIEDCLQHYGKTPMALLNSRLKINPMFTAVHCTHTAAADMDDFLAAGGNVCINPLTEGNLGDGISPAGRVVRKQGRMCLGSDSNLRLCWPEEMRWLEYGQRLATLQRGICVDEQGSVAHKLLEVATLNGARALGVKSGRISQGNLADFAALDLTHPALEGWTQETLLDAFVFGSGNEVVADVCVGGRWNNLRQTARKPST